MSPVKFFIVHAKKWGENRVSEVVITISYSICLSMRNRDMLNQSTENAVVAKQITTTQYEML
jgi:hypothetical protein